jgi:hypothetical protein
MESVIRAIGSGDIKLKESSLGSPSQPVDTLPVHELSALNGHSLRFCAGRQQLLEVARWERTRASVFPWFEGQELGESRGSRWRRQPVSVESGDLLDPQDTIRSRSHVAPKKKQALQGGKSFHLLVSPDNI